MATITLNKTTIKAGETAVVSFTVDISHMMGVTNREGVRTVNDVTITGGTISAGYDFRTIAALSTPTTKVYQGTFTPTPNLDRTECTISYNPSGTDNDATSAVFIVDTRAPTLTGTPTIGNPNLTRANQVTTISFVFSEQLDQASFTTADLTIPAGMGTLENLRTTDGGRSWQVDLRAPANTEAKDLQIGINMAGITDVAGNPGTGNVNLGIYHIDTKPPSIVSVVGPTSIVLGDTDVTITFTFSEAVTGFTLDNINLENSSASPYVTYRPREPVSADGGRTWTITYRAAPGTTDSTNTVSIRNLDGVRDLAGNAAVPNSSANTGNYEVDAQDPYPTSATFDKTHLAAGETATVTVTFNEIVNNVTEDTFQIPNGSVSNLRQDTTDGRIWRATFTPTANLQSTSSSISINLNDLRDSAGNTSSGSLPFYDSTITIDTKRPEVAVTISDERLTVGQTATITFTFTERVTGFDLNDVQYDSSKGTLSALTAVGTDGKVWSATYTPSSGIESATNTIRVNLAGVQDAQGNAGAGSASSGNFSIDTKPPEVTVTISDERLSAGETATVTFTFSERVTGFVGSDGMGFEYSQAQYDTSKGTLSALTAVGTDGKVWSASYTPRPGIESADNTIRVNLSDVRDAQGNAGEGTGTSGNFSIDTKSPEVTVTISDERLTAGETATVTFTFSETVTGFSDTSIVVDRANGSLSNLRQDTADGRIWTATFTPTASLSNTRSQISVNYEGIRDRYGNGRSGTSAAHNYTVDTAVFAIISATVNGRQLVLQYSDETALDPEQTHNAPNDAFVVLVNGTRNNVTGVVVDAAAKTITLTLANAVTQGQQVSVAYNDPSTGDDPQAVQEATGNDAASFAAKPATNVSPPPPPPPPPTTGCIECARRTGLGPRRPVQRPRGPGRRPAAPRWLGRPVW
ncbi:Ig-like domain-containing protein [Verminephrobacter eiseniae]|uniref:Ig-like domain-containing protein n=2 Tax=Verminephrobacter eiseniae TaxID=364317 RepID=UPI0038B3279E